MYVDKILAIDPANQFATAAKPALQKLINKPASPAPAPKKPAGAAKTGAAAKK